MKQLEESCRAGTLIKYGISPKQQEKILSGIDFLHSNSGRVLLNEALPPAQVCSNFCILVKIGGLY